MNKKLGFSILSLLVVTIMLAGFTLPVGAKLGQIIFSNFVNGTSTTMDDVSDMEVVDDVDEVDDDVNEYELTGTVEVISAESWIIGGVTFLLTAETEIEDLIVVGDIVKVEAFSDGQGGYIASEIELVDDDIDDVDDDVNEYELTGTVEVISAESWIIGGMTFLVTADTEIEDSIVVGDIVKVEAFSDGQGGFIASEIELVNDDVEDVDGDEIEMTGTVEVISAESWIIGGVTFLVTAETEIEDSIAVGDIVKVEAFSDGQGGYIASEIELVDDDMEDTDTDDDSDTDDDDDFEDDDDSGDDVEEDD